MAYKKKRSNNVSGYNLHKPYRMHSEYRDLTWKLWTKSSLESYTKMVLSISEQYMSDLKKRKILTGITFAQSQGFCPQLDKMGLA